MAMFVANAVKGKGPVFDVRPVREIPGPPRRRSRRPNPWVSRPAGFIKNAGQGAGAGLLTLLGSIQILQGGGAAAAATSAPPAYLMDSSFGTVLQNLLASAPPGVLQIAAAAMLFFTAGHGIARVIGLLGFIGLAAFYANGSESADFVALMEQISLQFSGFANVFQAAAV